jgi:hypothetical protein
MNSLVAAIAAKLFELLWPMIEKELKEKVLPAVMEKLSALLPIIVAAATKTVTEQVLTHLPDVDLPNLPSVPDLAEKVRQTVNQIPEIDIPILSDVFDLSEWIKNR